MNYFRSGRYNRKLEQVHSYDKRKKEIMGVKEKYSVQSIKPSETYDWLKNKHYAKRIPSISYAFGLYENTILQGVCTFGEPPVSNWETEFKILELNRLCIHETNEKNKLSYFISHCLKLINKSVLIVSFADPNQNHHGYIYQATNWIYTGVGSNTISWYLEGKEYHNRHMNKSDDYFLQILKSRGLSYDLNKTVKDLWVEIGGTYIIKKPKHRYFYILGNRTEKKLIKQWIDNKYKIVPYPKGDNHRYDASYEPKVQSKLL